MSDNLNPCPECGAADSVCETRFHECLTREFEDPAYGAVHHLTVAAYMLQHSSKLTREGWLHERELLKEFLVENYPPELIRKQNKDLVDSDVGIDIVGQGFIKTLTVTFNPLKAA